MDKKKAIAMSVAAILVCIASIIGIYTFPKKEDKPKEVTDALKFKEEYTLVPEDNVFVYRDYEEIIKIMEHGTGVVYLGFPECPWCQSYVVYLNEVAKEEGLDRIYYYNMREDRKENNERYQKLVSILKGKLQFDEEGNERIYTPNISFHIDGKIIGNDYETSKDTHNLEKPEDYWTKEEVSDLKKTLKSYIKQVVNAKTCNECN